MSDSTNATDHATKDLHPLHSIPSVTISNEMFEKLYLNPQNRVKGDLRKTFANPTPLYVIDSYPAAAIAAQRVRISRLMIDNLGLCLVSSSLRRP